MSLSNFSTPAYREHNIARLTHLSNLGLPIRNKTVLDVGAGNGDHAAFYLAHRCKVMATDARPECVDEIATKYAGRNIEGRVVDMNAPKFSDKDKFEIVHCYGLLYHLHNPDVAIAAMGKVCTDLLVMETCVSHEASGIEYVSEDANETPDMTQSVSGRACRPSRQWVMDELRKHFPHVYMTRSQPAHPEFPTDWLAPPIGLARAVFVASRKPLDEAVFSESVLDAQ